MKLVLKLLTKLLLQISAMAPQWLTREDVPADVVESETRSYRKSLWQKASQKQSFPKRLLKAA